MRMMRVAGTDVLRLVARSSSTPLPLSHIITRWLAAVRHARAVVQRGIGRRRRRGRLRRRWRRPRRRPHRPTNTCPRRPSGRVCLRWYVRVRSEWSGRCAEQWRVDLSVVNHVDNRLYDVQYCAAQHWLSSTTKPQSIHWYYCRLVYMLCYVFYGWVAN